MTAQSSQRTAKVPRTAGILASLLAVVLLAATGAGAAPGDGPDRTDTRPLPGLVADASATTPPKISSKPGAPGTDKSASVRAGAFDAAASTAEPESGSGFVPEAAHRQRPRSPQAETAPVTPAAAEALNVTVAPASAPRTQLAEAKEVKISASGLDAGESYRVLVAAPGGAENDLTFVAERNADDQGKAAYTLRYADPSFARAGTYTVTVRGERSGDAGSAGFDILDEPALPAAGKGAVTASPAVSTRTEAYTDGIGIELTGFGPGEQVDLEYVRPLGDRAHIDTYTASAQGTVSDTIVAESTQSEVGVYTLLAIGQTTGHAYGTFTVSPDPTAPEHPAENVEAAITPRTIDQIALAQSGVKITAHGFRDDERVQFRYTSPTGRTVQFGTRPAGKDGTYTSPFYDTSGRAKPGTHTITLAGADSGYVQASFTVTKSDVTPDPAVTISPDTVAQDQLFATTMAIEGKGFIPGDYIRQVLIWPNGSTSMQLPGYMADPTGAFRDTDFQVQDPLMPQGTYIMRFSGRIAGTLDVRWTVTEPADNDPGTFSLTTTPSSLSRSQLHDPGITVSATGLKPGETVALEAVEPSTARSVIARGTANGDGAYSTTVKSRSATAVDEGTLRLTLHTSHSRAVTTDVEINDAKNPPEITLTTRTSWTKATVSTFVRHGITVTASGLDRNEKVTVSVTLPDGRRSVTATVTATADGKLTHRLKPAPTTPQQGRYTVQLQGQGAHYGQTAFTAGREGTGR
ncbi:hypothetical protein [Streptomyces sp. N1]|uniref:hypothetical protein n=1 Tax=Streptomyces sp. N1 TaxID=576456 RepID=UPI0010111E8E|nr:hypothetical protein [Streptomyces sp. N1]